MRQHERRAHIIKPNKTSEGPQHFLLLDTETLPYALDAHTDEHRLRLGSVCFWRRPRYGVSELEEWHDFASQDELWVLIDRLCAPHQRLCIVAHNVGFDLQVIGGLHTMAAQGWQIEPRPIIDDPPFILRARKDTRSLYVLDWYNYFRGSLAYAGQLLGVPKMPMPLFDDTDDAWRTYCRRDVQVLYQAMRAYISFVQQYDLGAFAPTLAGQAFNAYRHRFMDSRIYVHTDKRAIELERRAYYGGRVELFAQGKLPRRTYTYLDVNGMYASVMRAYRFPTKLVSVLHNPSVSALDTLTQRWAVVADVELDAPQPLYPLRTAQRLLFPIGGFGTTLCTPELAIALERRHVKSVGDCAIYQQEDIFSKWVEEIYRLRVKAQQEGNGLWDELLKRMTNSLFGKFGQRNYDWETLGYASDAEDGVWEEHNLDTGERVTYRCLGGLVERQTPLREAYNSCAAIAAHVTSSARVLLLSYIERADFSHVYYSDTDSLIVDEVGLERLQAHLHQTELGKLKVLEQSDDVVLLAPKHYLFGQRRAHKGRRRDAIDLDDGSYQQEQFVSLAGALRRGWQGGPLVQRITKRDSLDYLKGTVQADGRITPYLLGGERDFLA